MIRSMTVKAEAMGAVTISTTNKARRKKRTVYHEHARVWPVT
jgi:hypothetical protein